MGTLSDLLTRAVQEPSLLLLEQARVHHPDVERPPSIIHKGLPGAGPALQHQPSHQRPRGPGSQQETLSPPPTWARRLRPLCSSDRLLQDLRPQKLAPSQTSPPLVTGSKRPSTQSPSRGSQTSHPSSTSPSKSRSPLGTRNFYLTRTLPPLQSRRPLRDFKTRC